MSAAFLDAIVAEARPLTEGFTAAGYRLYLVGGVVRDLLLERPLSADIDLDFTTDATPEQIKTVLTPLADALWLQGEKFGTIGALLGGRQYEVTTHRSERYVAHSRKPDVEFSTAIDEDLSRRDFTVNAMAIELPGRALVDPFGGERDLHARRLATPLDPEVSFTDDPLRMMRAARFVPGYGLEATEELVAAMARLAPRLDIVSAERVRDELDKLLDVPRPGTGLELLHATGLLERVLPEVDDRRINERIPVIDALPPDPLLRLATLLAGDEATVVNHRLRQLRHSNSRRRATAALLQALEQLRDGGVTDAPGLRRWVAGAGEQRDGARVVAAALLPGGEELVARSIELEAAHSDVHDLTPALTGDQVMGLLHLPPGQAVGEALDFLRELRFDEGVLAPADAEQRLVRWWGARSTDGGDTPRHRG